MGADGRGDLATWREWRAGAAVGVLILTLGSGAGTYGQMTVASSVAGTLSALLPLFAAILGYVMFRERLPTQGIVGLVVGFIGIGIGLLLRPGSGLDLRGVAVIIVGQIAWAAQNSRLASAYQRNPASLPGWS